MRHRHVLSSEASTYFLPRDKESSPKEKKNVREAQDTKEHPFSRLNEERDWLLFSLSLQVTSHWEPRSEREGL